MHCTVMYCTALQLQLNDMACGLAVNWRVANSGVKVHRRHKIENASVKMNSSKRQQEKTVDSFHMF